MKTHNAEEYHCPGAEHAISRSVHLGRLARFYPACRGCRFRDDGALSSRLKRQLASTWQRDSNPQLFDDEGLRGVYANQLDAAVARRAALALAACVRRQTATADPPTVVIGSDGRSLTAELIEAVSEGLRRAGCCVVDIGSAPASCLALTVAQLAAAGGLLVGNAPSRPHTVGLKFWGAGGQPLSAGGGLDSLRSIYDSGCGRPVRKAGTLVRRQRDNDYLAGVQAHFHALRPLRIALDCACHPLRQTLDRLIGRVACTLLDPGSTPVHLSIRIDGDGETCTVVDEHGDTLPGDRLLMVLARHLLAQHPGGTVVLEHDSVPILDLAVRRAGGHVAASGASREQMYRALRDTGALVGGGASGRIWLKTPFPAADALRTLALLMVILSQTDRPLSAVVASTDLSSPA